MKTIPILYPRDEKQFKTFGLGEISGGRGEVVRERNGNYTLYIEYPKDYPLADVFEEEMQIKANAGVRTKWQTFIIDRINRNSSGMIKIYAKHISHTLEKTALPPVLTIVKQDAEGALREWSRSLIGGEKFDVWSDIDSKRSLTLRLSSIENAREALGGVRGSILHRYGGEYEFDNHLIRLHKEMGRLVPTVLEYGRNITSLEQDKKTDTVHTSIYPYAIKSDDDDEDDPTKQTIYTIDEYIVDGQYVDMYPRRMIRPVDFSQEFEHDEIPTKERLKSLGEAYVKNNNIGAPRENIRVKYIDLSKTMDYEQYKVMEEVELCDRVPIYYPKFDITNHGAKVVKVTYDPYLNENKSINVGSMGRSFSSTVTGEINDRLDSLESTTNKNNQTLLDYIVNAEGNRIWRVTPPDDVEHKIGDVWFKKNGIYEIMLVWDGSQWVEILNTEDLDRIAREVEKQEEALAEHQRKIDEIRKRQDKELAEFEDSLAEIKANQPTHEELAEEIERLIGEYQLDDEAIDAAIERAGFSREEIDEIKKMAQEVNAKTEGVLEIVGEAGKPPEYSKNLSKTETVSLDYGESPKALELFKELEAGQTYTLSYEAVCEPYETATLAIFVYGTLDEAALYTSEEEYDSGRRKLNLDNSQKYKMTLTPVKDLPEISTTDVNHEFIYWVAEPVVGEHILTIESPGYIKPFRHRIMIEPGVENICEVFVQLELQAVLIDAPMGTVCKLTNEYIQEEPFEQFGNLFHVPIFEAPYVIETVKVPQFYEHYRGEVLVDRPEIIHKIELQRKPAEWVTRILNRPIPFPTEEVENPEMMPGEREVVQEGVHGMEKTTWEVEVIDGIETGERRNERTELVREPVPEIIHIGTAKVEWRTETRREVLKRATEEIQDPNMERGTTRTVTGRDGYREYTFERKYINDKQTDETRNEKLTDIMASVSDKIYIGARVTEWREETRRETIPYQTVYRDDPDLEKGETRFEGGTDGYRMYSFERKYINGVETSDIRNERVMYTVEASDAVIYRGTKETLELPPGVRKISSDTYEIDYVTLRTGECSMPAVATKFVKELLLRYKLRTIIANGKVYEVIRFDEASSSFWGYDFHLSTEPSLHLNSKVTAQFIFN